MTVANRDITWEYVWPLYGDLYPVFTSGKERAILWGLSTTCYPNQTDIFNHQAVMYTTSHVYRFYCAQCLYIAVGRD